MKWAYARNHGLLPFLLLSLYWPFVSGNTEIVNFGVESSNGPPTSSLPDVVSQWPRLSFETNEQRFDVLPARLGTPMTSVCETAIVPADGVEVIPQYGCPHELWLVLDLAASSWSGYNKFTLRLSWPASFPTDFQLQIYDADALLRVLENRFGHTYKNTTRKPSLSTRIRYAHVKVVDAGVLTPKSPPSPSSPERTPVPFILILEPLYFGVLPASVVPTLFLMLPVIASAFIFVPRIATHLEGIAKDARQEMAKNKVQ